MREAEAATAARHEAERVSELLRGQLAQAQQQVESARRKESADVAAAREQLVVSKRETAAANASLASAREAQRAAEASLAECKAALASKDVEVSMANEAQEEEGRTRVFLERVLKDERNHAARRAEVRKWLARMAYRNRTARTWPSLSLSLTPLCVRVFAGDGDAACPPGGEGGARGRPRVAERDDDRRRA